MKSTIEYLEKAKEDGGFKDWRTFVRAIGWTDATLSRYRSRERVMNRRACLQLAAFMKLDLQGTLRLQVLAEVEENGQLQLALKDFFKRVAVWIGCIGLGASIATSSKDATAAQTNTTESGYSQQENAKKANESTDYTLCDNCIGYRQ